MKTTQPAGGRELPVGKIVAVGRNYLHHIREMGAVPPSEPMLFLKAPTALLVGGGEVRLPPWTSEVHHEVEMVVRLGAGGRDLDEEAAVRAVDAVAIGIDLTARDVQRLAKERGEPWSVAKGFDGAAPISRPLTLGGTADLDSLEITLEINGELRQRGSTSDMMWSVPALLAFISTRFTLEPGDLLFTGTPEGVGPVISGDRIRACLGDEHVLEVSIA